MDKILDFFFRQKAPLMPLNQVKNQQDDQDTENASRRRTATDASMLIDHASRGGVRIDDAIMQQMLQWIQKVRGNQQITIEENVAFWKAYQSINAAVLPANVDSIRERLKFDDTEKNSQLAIASRRSRHALIGVLVVTLMVHCYFAFLQSLITDAQTAETAFANAKIPVAATDPTPSSLEAAAERLRAASCIWRSNIELLGDLLFIDDVVHWILGRTGSSGSNAAATTPQSGACTREFNADNLEVYKKDLLSVPIESKNKLGNDAALLTRAISARNAISQFVLPLLYGWLGALAYGLRTFASELRSVTFSRATRVEQKMRIPLGILAGATVGLLIQPETLNTIQGVTSIGIAFGLGFSVDLFFDLLEGLMARLRGTSVAQAASPIRSAAEAVRDAGAQIVPSESVTIRMIPYDKIAKIDNVKRAAAHDERLDRVVGLMINVITRVIVFDEKKPIFIIRKNRMEKFLGGELKFNDATRDFKIDNYLRTDDNGNDATQFGFVPKTATVDTAYTAMRNANSVDMFVTETGQKTEPVLGWLPDDRLKPT